MRTIVRKSTVAVGIGLFVLAVVALIMTAPKHPVALIQVVDAAGKPVEGAIVTPEGMRTKPGPYVSGWYSWVAVPNGAPDSPVKSDAKGYVRLLYPQFVFERIETGTLCLSVRHPDYVSDRPERVVATAPPVGAPWRERISDLWDRVRHVTLVSHPDPIVLQRGAVVEVSLTPDDSIPAAARMFAQVSGET
jgi:hypothetical protein